MLEITTIGIQIVLPLALLTWMLAAPLKSRMGFGVQSATTLFALVALALTAVWLVPPWWTPMIYLALWLYALQRQRSLLWGNKVWLPRRTVEYFGVVLFLPVGLWTAYLIGQGLAGRALPDTADVVELPFPMGNGAYLVANGGSRAAVNAHFLTLAPKTQRQRAYHGQSFAVDLIKFEQWGLRADGWRPKNPAAYAIFGEPVLAPCSGVVIAASDGMPDMPVPEPDSSQLEGNHVLVECGDFAVLVAHLRQSSVLVSANDHVETGQKLGEVGNSGQTFEPHLHIHAQRLAAEGAPLLSGKPLYLTFDGIFPVRNARVHRN